MGQGEILGRPKAEIKMQNEEISSFCILHSEFASAPARRCG